MNKIRIKTGDYTKEELLERIKLFDKPLFELSDNGLYMLSKDGKYEYVSCSSFEEEFLSARFRFVFEDILSITGFKLPNFKEVIDEDVILYSKSIVFDKGDFYFEDSYSRTLMCSKWWSKEANDYIKNNVLKDKVFQKWIENKFKGFRYV